MTDSNIRLFPRSTWDPETRTFTIDRRDWLRRTDPAGVFGSSFYGAIKRGERHRSCCIGLFYDAVGHPLHGDNRQGSIDFGVATDCVIASELDAHCHDEMVKWYYSINDAEDEPDWDDNDVETRLIESFRTHANITLRFVGEEDPES